MTQEIHKNSLYYGDCLDWMREWPAGAIDLIYLDPPFNSNAKYSVMFSNASPEEKAQYEAFDDTWSWDEKAIERYQRISEATANPLHDCISGMHKIIGECGMLSYLTYMGERLVEMHCLLKSSGSIYLHCDPTASHYLKLLMDAVFGKQQFRNEIIWGYRTGGVSRNYWPKKHDTILFYTKTATYTFNPLIERVYYRKKFFGAMEDGKGRYYADVHVRNVWDCEGSIKPIINVSKERLGYPTQKPKALLERIINASSNEGDLVLDPFCGSGTTLEAANGLKRRWIGIDASSFALRLIKQKRLNGIAVNADIHGIPADAALTGGGESWEAGRVLARARPSGS